jgi:hypothetical protein
MREDVHVSSSTDATLEAIDSCLRDASVSPDAMRWSPDPETAEAFPDAMRWSPDPEAAEIAQVSWDGYTCGIYGQFAIYGQLADAYADFRASRFAHGDEHWVMDLATYTEMRRASGDDTDPETWQSDAGDRMLGLPIEVREDCTTPRVESPWPKSASLTCGCMPSREGYGGLFIDANGCFYGPEAERLHQTHCPDLT